MIILNYIKYINKKIVIIIFLLLISSCNFKDLSNSKTVPTINQYVISEYEIPENYFISNYKNHELKNYDKQKTTDLYNKLKKKYSDYSSLNKSDIFNLMGIPSLVKSTNKNEIWQYRSKDCILNIIWNNNNNNISSFFTYDITLEKVELQQCFLNIISNNMFKHKN